MYSIRCTTQILRLMPQNDIATQSPTGEDRGEGALIFCPLTLTLSRQGRENRLFGIVQQAKYFVGLGINKTTLKKIFPAKAQRKGSFISPNLACFASLRRRSGHALRELSFFDPVICLVRFLPLRC